MAERAGQWARRNCDGLLAVGLLLGVVLVVPASLGLFELIAGLVVTVALTTAALHAIRRAGAHRAGPFGSAWARAVAALGASASILMIAGATVAVLT